MPCLHDVLPAEGRLEIVIANGTYVNTTYEVQFNLTSPADNADYPRNVTIHGFGEFRLIKSES